MKYYLFVISLIFHQCLFSQRANNNFSVTIIAETSVSGSEFIMNIYRDRKKIKIVYQVRDSIDYASIENDKHYNEYRDTLLKLFNNLKNNRDNFLSYIARSDSVRKRYTYYTRDSILLKAKSHISYSKFLDEILMTGTDVLENKAVNKNRIVLDGTDFTFIFIAPGRDRVIHVRSPRQDSHPLLYQLVSATLNMYRRSNTNTFLDKKYTSGY